jgi:hypothetical protein
VRTTLGLDDDVAAPLRRAVTRRKEPLKKALNDALREGFPRLLRPRSDFTRLFTAVVAAHPASV